MSKQKTILVSNKDFVYGVKHNHYPEISEINNGNVLVCTENYLEKKGINLIENSNDEDAIYVYNQYSDTYMPVNKPDIARILFIDKAIAIREALVALGAKHISITNEIEDIKDIQNDATISGNVVCGSGQVDGKYRKQLRLKLESIIKSNDPHRTPSSIEVCSKSIYEKGLSHNTNIISLFNRMKDSKEQRLFGEERVSLEYEEELKPSFDVAVGLSKHKILSVKVENSYSSSILHSFKYEIIVDFGD